MKMTHFQQQIAATFAKAGFQPVSADMQRYTFICGSNPAYKRAIDGTLNEVVVKVYDNYALIYAFRPSESGTLKSVIYKSDAIYNDAEKVLEKARFAWKVGKAENGPCQRLTANSRFKEVCNFHFADDGRGGIVCSHKCWIYKKPRRDKRFGGYFD